AREAHAGRWRGNQAMLRAPARDQSTSQLRPSRTALAHAALHSDKNNGETGCEVSDGTPWTKIYSPSLCTRTCVERHEAVHAADLKPCCQKANKAFNKAADEDAKNKVQARFDKWVNDNRDWFECHAYAESMACAAELVAKDCATTPSPEDADAG